MANEYKPLTDDEIQYVRCWAKRYDVNKIFTFEGWKNHNTALDASDAPAATRIGRKVVEALNGTGDSRLDFIALAEGPGLNGKTSITTSGNLRYYKRLK